MYQAGLVLEGGGMKGVYTAGVLDFFLDKGIEFSSCYGVSAGACALCSFLSKQRGRAYHVNVDYLDDRNYCSLYSLIKTGDLFGEEMCYHRIPDKLYPYDYEAFNQYQGTFYSVVTNIETGRPEYIPIKDMKKEIDAIRASASLPLVSRNVSFRGKLYLDGGISDAIPVRRSMSERMENRHKLYNKTLDLIADEVKKGTVFLIQPKKKSLVGRIEKDREKLRALYEEGYEQASECYEDLMRFLKDSDTGKEQSGK